MKKKLFALLTAVIIIAACILPASAFFDNGQTNRYGWNWAHIVHSYLVPLDDGSYLCCNAEGSEFVAVSFGPDGKSNGEVFSLNCAPDTFAGFFAGEEYYFIATASDNEDESDEKTVLTVIKYDKSFNRLGATEFKGENTFVAVNAGSLRMTETGGKLYVHTCHTMYTSEDGFNHQANMTFVIDESTMTKLDGFSGVMNLSWGYASHSFNQFIDTDGDHIYRVDHGDAYPRGISVTKAAVGGKITDVDYAVPYSIPGTVGDNYTGVEVGGFAVGEKNLFIAAVEPDGETGRNEFLIVVSKNLKTVKKVDIGGSKEAQLINPFLVPYKDGKYLFMFEEYYAESGTADIRCFIIDEDGNTESEACAAFGTSFSDCRPVYCADGLVRWTVIEKGVLVLHTYDPAAEPPAFIPGDVNGNGKIDSADYAMCKRAFLKTYTLDAGQLERADINKNGKVDAAEYAMIKRHFLKTYVIPGAAGK